MNTPDTELKEWFEANYLDGDEVQEGQMLASSECLEALTARDTYWKERVDKISQKWLTAIDMEIEDMNAQGSVFEEMTDRIIAQVTPITKDNIK